MYGHVREQNIRIIIIIFSVETGEEFFIQDNMVTCRLNFRLRPLLAYTYIRKHEFKSYQFKIL